MDFSKALEAVKNGQRIQREGWNGKDLTIQLQVPDTNSKMNLPYLYIEYPDGKRCPWLASQTDILAEDWKVIPSFKLQGSQKLYAYKNSHGKTCYLEYEFNGNQALKRDKSSDKIIQ